MKKSILRFLKYCNLIAILILLFAIGNFSFGQSQTFNYTGSAQTFTVPAGVTSVTVAAWGGGGGGGGSNSNNNGGSGGGGGGYCLRTYTVVAGQQINISVGSAGSAGASNAGTGGTGGTTSVTSSGGFTTLTASGGTGGAGNKGTIGTGGTATGGTTNTSGNDGLIGTTIGGNGGNGGNGGTGGTGSQNATGGSGTAPGGGGGGGERGNGNNYSGGSGAEGQVSISWVCPANAGTLSGIQTVCVDGTTTFSSTVPGGVWTSGNIAIATIDPSTGVITGISAGGPVTMTYTVDAGGGCTVRTATRTVTVYSSPSAPATTGAYLCIGTTTSVTLSASGAIAGQVYKWYNAATGGTLLKTSTNNTDNTYTTPALGVTTDYWVSISNGTCESSRTQVTATYPVVSSDSQTLAGSNSWIGHVYKRLDAVAQAPSDANAFTNYYGTIPETETFNETFGGSNTCFSVSASESARTIYSEYFAVRYRMNSTKKGLYVASMGSDDGFRLTVDGVKVSDVWVQRGYVVNSNVLFNLTGSSNLLFEYYESGGGNQVSFQSLTQVLGNTLSVNTSQSICVGSTAAAISGDVFGVLPSGISLSGTGYQWSYSTSPGGARTNISGATGATFTPNTSTAPFNTAGTYYVYRNVSLSGANNVSPNPYVATNESNAATIIVDQSVGGAISGGTSPLCLGTSTGTMTLTGYSGTIVRWEYQPNSSGWTDLGNGGSATLSHTPWDAGTANYRVYVQSGSCTAVYSSVKTITVDAVTAVGYLGGGTTPICEGSSLGTLTLGTSTGAIVQWEKRLNSGVWTIISNSSNTYSEIPSSGGTWDYRALVQSGSCASVYSNNFSIVVNPTLTITLGSFPSVCQTTTTTSIPYSATTGSPGQWRIDFNAAATTAGFSSPQNGSLAVAPGNIPVNVPYSVATGVYNGTLTVSTSYPVCTSVGYPITVTVNNDPLAIDTPTSSNITNNTADLGGNISSLGCSNVTERGIYWSTTSGFADGTGTKVSQTGSYYTGSFTVATTGLSANTTYYFKAFATNSGGTVYSTEGTFTTFGPIITVGTLSDFGFQAINTTSSEKNYLITGSYLTNSIIVTPPTGFEISTTSGSGYSSNPITLTPSSGNVNQTIYVVFHPTATQVYSGNITNTSTGATGQNVAVTGTSNWNYCTPSGSCSQYITGVILGGINNTTTCSGGYANYTNLSADVVLGQTGVSVTISFNSTPNNYNDLSIWIDWNKDGDFDDAGEQLFCPGGYSNLTNPSSISFDVPVSASLGSTTMRIAFGSYGGGAGGSCGTPCGTTGVFEVEDYSINVSAPCNTPDTPIISATSTTICSGESTTLSITPGNLNDADHWQWYSGSCGGTALGQGTSITVSPTSTTTYYARGEGNSCDGVCGEITVTVNPKPGAVSITPNSSTLCIGDIQQLTADGGSENSNTILLSELFNSTSSAFTASGTNTTAVQNTNYYSEGSSSFLFQSTPDGTNHEGYLTLTNSIDISAITSPQLTFSHICALEVDNAPTIWDIGIVEYSLDGGTNWVEFPSSSYAGSGTLVTNYYWGTTSGVAFSSSSYPEWSAQFTSEASTPGSSPATSLWKSETLNIPAVSSTFKIRFHYAQDQAAYFYGWLIDNLRISGNVSNNYPITWTPTTGLYTDAAANVSYTGGAAATVYAKPSSTTIYTATATSVSGCTASNTVTVNASNPQVSSASVSPTSVCGSGQVSFSATASEGTIKWYDAAMNGNEVTNLNPTISTETTYYAEATSSGGCISATRTAVTASVITTPSTSLAVSDASICNPATGDATITITGAETGVTYELQTLAGASLSPAVSGTGTGIDLVLTIVQANVPTVTTSYKIVAGISGCSNVDLTDQPTVTVDNDGPVFAGCPTDISQDIDNGLCSAVVTWAIPTITDACGGTLTLDVASSASEVITEPISGFHRATIAVGSSVITYTATDEAGNKSYCTFNITVQDLTDPVITNAPTNQTYFCESNIPVINTIGLFTAAGGVYTDNAGSACGAVTVSYLDDPISGGIITRHYTLTDAGSNSATCTQDFTISQPTVSITSQTTTTCIGGTFTITDETSYPGTVYRQWQTRANSSSVWIDISGETGVTYDGTLASFEEQYRLLVSEDNVFTNVLCYLASSPLQFSDSVDPYFTSYAPETKSICTVPGQSSAAVSGLKVDAIDVIDNCTIDLLTGLTYSITGAGATTAASTGVNLTEPTDFNVGVSTITYEVTDAAGNSAQLVITVTVNAAPDPISISHSVVSGGGTGIAPNQCGTYGYSVEATPEAGFTYQWIVYSGSGTSGSVVSSGYNLVNSNSPGQPASVEINWTGDMLPGTYTIEAIKTGANACTSEATLEINLQNSFDLQVQAAGQDCKGEVTESTPFTITWTVDKLCGTTSWGFAYYLFAQDISVLPVDYLTVNDGTGTFTGITDVSKVFDTTATNGNPYIQTVYTLFIINPSDSNNANDFNKFYLKGIPETSEISTD